MANIYGEYELWLDGIRMPVMPPKMTNDIPNRNTALDMLDGQETVMPAYIGRPVYEFELLLPNSKYPFSNYDGNVQDAAYYMEKLLDLKKKAITFEFIFIRNISNFQTSSDTTANVVMEKLKFTDDVADGTDIKAEISLKVINYEESKAKQILPTATEAIKQFSIFENAAEAKDITSVFKLGIVEEAKTVVTTGAQAGVPAVPEEIKTGALDSLQKIAQKAYGAASFVENIYQENKAILDGICQEFGLPKLSILPDVALKMPNIPSGILEYIKTGTLNNPLAKLNGNYEDIIKYVNDLKKIDPTAAIDTIPNGIL